MALRNVLRPFGRPLEKWTNNTTSVFLKQGLTLTVPNVRHCAAAAYGNGDSIFRQVRLLFLNIITAFLLAWSC